MMMKKMLLIILLTSTTCLSQSKLDVNKIPCDTIKKTVYDYFRQVNDSIFFDIGGVVLMGGEVLFDGNREYCCFENDEILVYKYKSKILFEYQKKDGKVNGLGFCYYHLNEKTALIGEFKNNKLHGNLYVFDYSGMLVEVLKYKHHIYFWLDSNETVNSRKNKYKYSKFDNEKVFR